MSIAGGIGAAIRRNDPYDGWALAHDYSGQGPARPGRVYLKRNGIIYPSFKADPQASFARSGADLLTRASDGSWRAYAANDDNLLLGSGFDVPEGTTNKCTHYNAAPQVLVAPTALATFNAAGVSGVTAAGGDAATLYGVVDDSATMSAGPLGPALSAGKLNGRVYVCDNTLGAATAFLDFSGFTGNTNPHTSFGFVRGSGTVRFGLRGTGGTQATDLTLTSNYVRGGYANITPGSATNFATLRVPAGTIVYVILNQLEEKAYATNPVIVSGVSAARGAALANLSGITLGATPDITVQWSQSQTPPLAYNVITLHDGTDAERLRVSMSSVGALTVVHVTGGVSTNIGGSVAGLTGAQDLLVRLAYDGAAWSWYLNGAKQGASTTLSIPPVNALAIGRSRTSLNFLNDRVHFVGIK